MKIRPLKIEDYDALVRLWRESELPYKAEGRDRPETLARELSGPCSLFLAAELDGAMVGAVLGTHDGRKGWINRVAVKPAYRRQGIARAQIDFCEHQARSKMLAKLALDVEVDNHLALPVYQHYGFQIIEKIESARFRNRFGFPGTFRMEKVIEGR